LKQQKITLTFPNETFNNEHTILREGWGLLSSSREMMRATSEKTAGEKKIGGGGEGWSEGEKRGKEVRGRRALKFKAFEMKLESETRQK